MSNSFRTHVLSMSCVIARVWLYFLSNKIISSSCFIIFICAKWELTVDWSRILWASAAGGCKTWWCWDHPWDATDRRCGRVWRNSDTEKSAPSSEWSSRRHDGERRRTSRAKRQLLEDRSRSNDWRCRRGWSNQSSASFSRIHVLSSNENAFDMNRNGPLTSISPRNFDTSSRSRSRILRDDIEYMDEHARWAIMNIQEDIVARTLIPHQPSDLSSVNQ